MSPRFRRWIVIVALVALVGVSVLGALTSILP
ncbi:hypothetical protein FB554_2514 [Barrientosiimonas humi]|uniref:Uncharacterized protein n=1 Tax=Barrientosiimonas humi TaxID=999931 RepID=A0A542XEX0_9MICO|nr:hypothetical protein FB554_2514 [Barrientosiimonas humi]CAG7574338.1 hypothetical protein BH39T_PBIAJDOK_02986 [Barrientosiimonas humi]